MRKLQPIPPALLAAGFALAITLSACGNDEEPLGAGPVTRLEILGASGGVLTLAAGASQEIEVGALDARGRDDDEARITASSSNEAVATVTGGVSASRIRLAHTGFDVHGVAAGSATLTFREEGSGVSADLRVDVTP